VVKRNWTSPPGYSPDKDEFDQLDDYGWRITTALKWLAAIAIALLLLSFPARYVADCQQTFTWASGTECLRAWAGILD
jgi:hypothetical protein